MSLPAPLKLPKKMTQGQKIALAASVIGGVGIGLWLYLTQAKPTEEVLPLETTAYPYTFAPAGEQPVTPTPEPTPTPTPSPEEQPTTPLTGTEAGAQSMPTMGETPTMPITPEIPTIPEIPTVPETPPPTEIILPTEKTIPAVTAQVYAPTFPEALVLSAMVAISPLYALFKATPPRILQALSNVFAPQPTILKAGPLTFPEALSLSAITTLAPIAGIVAAVRSLMGAPSLIPQAQAQPAGAWPTGFRPPAAAPTQVGYRPPAAAPQPKYPLGVTFGYPGVYYPTPAPAIPGVTRPITTRAPPRITFGAPGVYYTTPAYRPSVPGVTAPVTTPAPSGVTFGAPGVIIYR